MPPPWFSRAARLGRLVPYLLPALLLGLIADRWAPVETADSAHYRLLAENASPLELLASTRTPGYPLLLRGVGTVCGDLSCLPAVQLALHGLAAVALGATLFGAGLSRLAAGVAAGLVLAHPWVWQMAPLVRNDLPALSLAVASLAALVRVLGSPSPLAWVALGLATTASWWMRPAYLFLVPLVILLGAFGLPALPGGPSRGRARRLGLLAATAAAPLLLWCGLRWATVGHFGPVSFTGFNLIGLTASLVDAELVPHLPRREVRLAREVLRRRERLGLEAVRPSTPMASWWAQFSDNAWRAGAPAARRQARRDLERTRSPERAALLVDVEADRRLVRLSLALVRARPGPYLRWLGEGWKEALRRTLVDPWVFVPALTCVLAALARSLARRRGSLKAASTSSFPLATSRAWLGVAVAFFVGGAALALAVEPPEPRYLGAVGLLLPGALSACAIETWRSTFARESRLEGAPA